MGENIAAGYNTAQAVFEAWKSSPGHNENMLTADFLAIGIGLANVEGGRQAYAWTTDFSSVVDVDGCACSEGESEACESESCGPGLRTCLGHCQWSECGPPNPGVDVCDGYDNNCNGEIDEGDVCHGCVPETEICDDEDNDCDGLVDEEGVCGEPCEPGEEVCDANDNDCDGTVDEGCFCPDGSPDRVCGYDEGVCRTGIQSCAAGVWSECAGALAPRIELCDGLDNDCDGAVDERACGEPDPDPGDGDGGGGGCAVAGAGASGGAPGGAAWVLLAALALAWPRRRRRALAAAAAAAACAVLILCGCSKSTEPAGPDDGGEAGDPALEETWVDAEPDETADDSVPDPVEEDGVIPDIPAEDVIVEDTLPTDLPFGAACVQDGQCQSGLCLPAELGGTCSEECSDEQACDYGHPGTSCTPFGRDTNGNGLTDTVVTACASRPSGSHAAGWPCGGAPECHTRLCIEGGMCMNVCANDDDCVPAAVCLPHPFALDEGEGSYGACGFHPVSGMTLEQVPYASLSLVTEAAGGRRRDAFVPFDVISLTITAMQTAPAQAAMVGYLEVYEPAGTEIYDMIDYYDGLDPLNWHSPWIRMGMFMVPITPRVSISGGAYQFQPITARFAETDPLITVSTDITLQIKRSPSGTISSGTLGFNFFFVGLDSVNATNAQQSGGEFQGVIGWVRSIYSAAGISTGGMTYTDVAEPYRSQYRILNLDYSNPDLGELGGLLRLSAGRTEFAVNVFLVHDIDESGVLGMSPGIPGPQGFHGTNASGVVINYDSCWSQRSAGMVIAHEVGHYLGLFHPTEQSADPYPGDPIPDTVYGDADNLMHWQWGGDEITAGQSFVLLRAALVQ
jgi:MYXO-CTERM domain-containing protein